MGSTQSLQELKTVDNLNINKYLGTWYQIARKPNSFQNDNAINTTAEYSFDEYDNIKVINKETINDQVNSIEESAFVSSYSNSKLRVSCFLCFYGDYWVIILGNNYEYSVVSDRYGKNLWILSRTKSLNNLSDIINKIKVMGIDTSDLIYTKQI